MGVKEVLMQRCVREVTHDVPGIGPVVIRRLTWKQLRELPNLAPETLVAATVEEDGKLFFSDGTAVLESDGALGIALANAVMEVNRLPVDVAAAEKK